MPQIEQSNDEATDSEPIKEEKVEKTGEAGWYEHTDAN